jgi:hypothetical protein
MEKLIHILNLDNTTITVDIEPWIINKLKPNEPIIRLKPGQRKLLEAGTFKGDEHQISYSGREYWLSNELYEELERKTKKDVDLAGYGVSYAEFFNPEQVAEQANRVKICSDNIEHLKNTEDDVIIVSERSDLDLHSELLDTVREKLGEYNIDIMNIYMLAKNNLKTNIVDVSYEKALLVIEKMTGFKIVDGKFTNIPVDQYNKIFIYDDNRVVFDELNTIQETFNKIYYNTNENIKPVILNIILGNKPFVKIHQVTSNEFNKFKTDTIMMKRPTRIYKFNFFK